MKISFKGDYALKIILDLSINFNKGMIQIKDISKRQDIPEKYLEQIILILKGANYIRTQRGPNGGIYLAKSPKKITLGEIIRLMDGMTAPVACVSSSAYSKCNYEKKCVFRNIWFDIKKKINDVVDNVTFEDLVKKAIEFQKEEAINYTI